MSAIISLRTGLARQAAMRSAYRPNSTPTCLRLRWSRRILSLSGSCTNSLLVSRKRMSRLSFSDSSQRSERGSTLSQSCFMEFLILVLREKPTLASQAMFSVCTKLSLMCVRVFSRSMKASKQYWTRLESAFLSKQLGMALQSACRSASWRAGWYFSSRVAGRKASLSTWILRMSSAIFRCSTCEMGVSTRNTMQSRNRTLARRSSLAALKANTSTGSRKVSIRYSSSVWMQSSQNYRALRSVEMSTPFLPRSAVAGVAVARAACVGSTSLLSRLSALWTWVCFLARFLASSCSANQVAKSLRDSSLKMQSESARQGRLFLMMAQMSSAMSPCLSVMWVASRISLKSSRSKSLKVSTNTSRFFPLVSSLCTSSRAQQELFLRPSSVSTPHSPHSPCIFCSGSPTSSISASPALITGALALRKYSSILRRCTDTLAMKPCWLVQISPSTALMNSVAAPFASSFFILQQYQNARKGFDIFQQQIGMDFKINFDQLFSAGGSNDLNTTHTTLEGPSIELSHQLNSSLNNSVQYKFSFNHNFFDPEDFDEREVHLEEQSVQERPPKSAKSIKISQGGQSSKSQPGERLYYQSQQQVERKMKQREKVHQEKQIEFTKTVTFVPTINEKSRKMAERQKLDPKECNKHKHALKPTIEVLEEADKKECTFHPKLIAKNKNKTKDKDELFYYLHNTAKIKEMKISKLTEEQYGQYQTQSKKGNQEDVTNFLKRNEEYTSVVKKKQQILKTNSEKYDLKTGEKLFSPKIIENKAYNYHATASIKDLKNPSSKNTKDNFKSNKGSENYEQQQPQHQPKSGIFSKKYKTESSEDYREVIQEGRDTRNDVHKDSSRSHHEVILEVEENSIVQAEKNHRKIEKVAIHNPYHEDDIQGEELNIWGSNEIKPFELSNVHQYLNSDEDEPEHKNNYVMDILNNLIVRPEEDGQ